MREQMTRVGRVEGVPMREATERRELEGGK